MEALNTSLSSCRNVFGVFKVKFQTVAKDGEKMDGWYFSRKLMHLLPDEREHLNNSENAAANRTDT